jgi:hypothetical protein
MPKNLLSIHGDLVTSHTFEDGKNYISYEQADVQPLMDFAHALRTEADPALTDKDAYCAVRLPMTVVQELMTKHGLNVLLRMEPKDEKRLWYLLETEYRAFKLTNKKLHR